MSKFMPSSIEERPIIKMRVQKTQKQRRSLCGYFACAFATALCNEIDIETLQFDENEMIKHWIRCIKEKKASMFPHKLKTRVNNTLHQIIRYKRDDF